MFRALLVLILTIACISTSFAQVLYPPEIAEIKKRGKLIIAMTSFDNPPFYSGTLSNMSGLDVDIAKSIAKALSVGIEYNREAKSFSEVVDQVTKGNADMAISKLSITGPRMTVVRFSTPYVKLNQAMLVNRLWLSQNSKTGNEDVAIRNFNGHISFIANSSYDTFARIAFPKATYKPESSWNNIIDGVISGKYAAGFRDEFEIKRITLEKPSAPIHTKTVVLKDTVDNIAVAVHPNSIHLLSIVDYVIKQEYNDIDIKRLIIMLKEHAEKNKE